MVREFPFILLLMVLMLGALFVATRYDPQADERILIEDVSTKTIAPTPTSGGGFTLCEKRQLVGRQYTLNPNAPASRQLQELIMVCVKVLPNGYLPRGPINIMTIRQPMRIA